MRARHGLRDQQPLPELGRELRVHLPGRLHWRRSGGLRGCGRVLIGQEWGHRARLRPERPLRQPSRLLPVPMPARLQRRPSTRLRRYVTHPNKRPIVVWRPFPIIKIPIEGPSLNFCFVFLAGRRNRRQRMPEQPLRRQRDLLRHGGQFQLLVQGGLHGGSLSRLLG